MRPARELVPECRPRPLAAREVADELEALADETARNERRLDRRRPRQDGHRNARFQRGGDEPGAGIVHPRQARVARQRNPLAGLEPRQHLSRPLGLVVLVVAEHPRLDPVPVEQDPRPPRVLAEDEVGLGELAQDAERDVLEVPDRRRADGERH